MATDSAALITALEALVSRAATLNGTTWRSTWLNTVTYASRDIVTHNNDTYMSLVNSNTNNRPSATSTKWHKMAVTVTVDGGGSDITPTDTPTPDAVPQSLADGTLALGWLPPGLNDAEQYASPDGDDDNDGLTWQTAKEHGYNAASVLCDASGGTLFLADNTAWGGPVANQGMWFRDDNFAVPGFLNPPAIRIVGCGNRNGGIFMPGVSANLGAVSGTAQRTEPSIWIVHSVTSPITIENIVCPSVGSGGQPVRIGVDYDRKVDGSLQELTVTNGTRTAGSTVFTVTLPSTGLATATASRTSNITTLVITNPGMPNPPLRYGVPFHLTSGNVDFPTGDYVVSTLTGGRGGVGQATWTITYADVGANKVSAAVAGNVKTHGAQANDWIELITANGNFTRTMLRVTASTVGTITCNDPYWGTNVNVNNIGTLVRMEFDYTGTTSVFLRNISAPLSGGDQMAGPGILIGRNFAINPWLINCYAEGLIGNAVIDTPYRDDYRQAQILSWAGNSMNSDDTTASGINLYQHTGAAGPVIAVAGNGACDVWWAGPSTLEYSVAAAVQALALPGVRIEGGGFTKVYIADLQVPDSFNADAKSVELISVPQENAELYRVGPNPILGPCIGGSNWWTPGYQGSTPWQPRHATFWGDGRMSAKHPGVVRAVGPVGARFKNLIEEPGTWTMTGGAITVNTADSLAPDGSQTATKVVSVGNGLIIKANAVTGDTWEIGGKFFMGGWFSGVSASSLLAGDFFACVAPTITFEETSGGQNGAMPAPVRVTGWQYISGFVTVEAVADPTPNVTVQCRFPNGTTCYAWGLTAYYVPAASADTFDVNDTYEHVGVASAQPRYLAKGMAGTFESQKFIAHGGFGTDAANAKVVGAGSGQLTLTGVGTVYLPTYAKDGTTITGWVAQLQATVNP